MRRLVSVVMLLCLCPALYAQDTWMSVLLDGRKIGHLQISRDTVDGHAVTRQALAMRMTRAGHSVPLSTASVSVEDGEGTPLAFSAETGMSSQRSITHGERRPDGNFQVTVEVAGQTKVDLMSWPTGALLAEGQRRSMLAHGFTPGTRYTMLNFDGGSRQVSTVEMLVIGPEWLDLPGGRERAYHLRQTLHTGRGEQVLELWIDDQARVRKGLTPMLGFQLEMVACDRTCALAPDQDVDMLRMAMVDAPRPLTPGMRASAMRYWVQLKDKARGQLIQTDEQQVSYVGGDIWQLDVGVGLRNLETPPGPDDLRSNAWLQSDNAQMHAAALAAVGDANTDLRRMRRLRSFVSEHINDHGLDVAYASALETLQSGRGDCTENAVLLTGLARSLGIPARVVTGMVYTSRFAGASRVFVPHAWTQAWINGRWVSFDAALRRYDSSHIALATGDGDPWRFFSAMQLFGNIRIDRAMPLDGLLESMPMPEMSAGPTTGNGAR